MSSILSLVLAFSDKFGYFGIIMLMAVESSFIPFPSEVVIPPAGFLAAQGQMNLFLVILSGVLGSVLGAIFNYVLALKLGRAIVHALARKKIAKFFLINEKKVIEAEEYFVKYGNMSTLLGRLIPAIRQLISIPAGISRMNFKNFVIYTALGSFIWNTILALLGFWFGANQDLLKRYYHEIGYAFILIALIVVVWLYLSSRQKNKK